MTEAFVLDVQLMCLVLFFSLSSLLSMLAATCGKCCVHGELEISVSLPRMEISICTVYFCKGRMLSLSVAIGFYRHLEHVGAL